MTKIILKSKGSLSAYIKNYNLFYISPMKVFSTYVYIAVYMRKFHWHCLKIKEQNF